MTDYEKLMNIPIIYDNLLDAESRSVFEARATLGLGTRGGFWDKIKCSKSWRMPFIADEKLIIFGCGKMGLYLKDVLERSGKNIVAFVDNNREIGSVEGIKIISAEQYADKYDEKIVMSNRSTQCDMIRQLYSLGVPDEKIIKEEYVCAFCGNQYFDVFEPEPNEIFIDAGAYDMDSSFRFADWCHHGYQKIYAFEPDVHNIKKCENAIKNGKLKNIELIKQGTYSKEKVLNFTNTGDGGSQIKQGTGFDISVTSIDKVLNGEEATFIKMDVEGSEMESLIGASETIKNFSPRLAICVYHKPFDFIDIPLYILELNPGYKFYMRHYASNYCETVLYAEPGS